jgi:hypothetical protein
MGNPETGWIRKEYLQFITTWIKKLNKYIHEVLFRLLTGDNWVRTSYLKRSSALSGQA